MPEIKYGSLPFDEAIQYFTQKGFALSPNSWRDVWQQAHARAFTVARVTEMDVLEDIRGEIDKAIEQGTGLEEFKKNLQKILERKGWIAPKGEAAIVQMPDGEIRKRLTGWRLETIYRENLQTSFQVGRFKQMQEVKARRPYWQYVAVMDGATRPTHAAQNGKVYHADHPFWDKWYPPNGFNCRCYVKTLSERQVEERGLTVLERGTDLKPDEGWAYNPGEAGLRAWQPDLSRYPKALLDEYFGGKS